MFSHLYVQIDDSVASLVIAQLLFLQSESNNKPIHMYINSPGKWCQQGLQRMVFMVPELMVNYKSFCYTGHILYL